jgi:hypothetical protein
MNVLYNFGTARAYGCLSTSFSRLERERPLENVHFCSSSRKAKILTTDIHYVFRGLQFETDAEIGQKGAFCKGLRDMRRRGAFCLYWDSNAYALPVFFIDREESAYHN